jgi:hypothetical protein
VVISSSTRRLPILLKAPRELGHTRTSQRSTKREIGPAGQVLLSCRVSTAGKPIV